MNKKVYSTLEFDKIISRLEAKATSEKGKDYCRKLTPLTEIDQIEKLQRETAAALERIFKFSSPTFSGVCDPYPYSKTLEIGGALSIAELLKISSLLEASKRARRFGDQITEDCLYGYFSMVEPVPALAGELSRCILSEDEIADDASSELSSIRRSIAATNDKIRSHMNSMLNSSTRDYLQDNIITIRDNRYCLSVKAEHKNYVPGMVHDSSASGATLFIEPMAVVNLNNQIRELQSAEKEEIHRILVRLSALVYENFEQLSTNFKMLSKLDFIFAKGQLAYEMNAVAPIFNDHGYINLRKARHPLIDKHSVVPIDLVIGGDYHQLIVTGPNTGGKTVSLKTCGLFALMGQSGLHIPANDRSELAIFHNIYADIGDEQSIEQSLSTFSSHMKNIIHILDGVEDVTKNGHDALVLFDELCAGTDPAEGAALAISILDRLRNMQVCTMATTHYNELKLYALSTPDVENACCEFSMETLSPTYHLLIGIPGKSNAFAISRKLGLSADLVNSAAERIDSNQQSFEDAIVDLEQRRVNIIRQEAEIAQAKRQIDVTQADIEAKSKKLEEQKSKIIEDAHLEASLILQEAKESADLAIRQIQKYGKSTNLAELEKQRTKVGKELKEARGNSSGAIKQPLENTRAPKSVKIGDTVKVLSMNTTGTVHTLPNAKGDFQVQMGILRSTINLKDCVLVEDKDELADKYGYGKSKRGSDKVYSKALRKGEKIEVDTRSSYGSLNKSASISTEIQLLGLNSDDAIAKLDKYLDDAYLSHLSPVRVVHGKGTGVLREAVHQYLRKSPIVAEYHLGEFGEGDSGVTIVALK